MLLPGPICGNIFGSPGHSISSSLRDRYRVAYVRVSEAEIKSYPVVRVGLGFADCR